MNKRWKGIFVRLKLAGRSPEFPLEGMQCNTTDGFANQTWFALNKFCHLGLHCSEGRHSGQILQVADSGRSDGSKFAPRKSKEKSGWWSWWRHRMQIEWRNNDDQWGGVLIRAGWRRINDKGPLNSGIIHLRSGPSWIMTLIHDIH